MKRVIRLCVCVVLCLALSLSLLCPASAEAPSVIAPEVLAYMEKAEDSALIPIWVFQKGLTKAELNAMFLSEIPNGLRSDEYEAARREIMRREFGAINTAFVEKYCDEDCKVRLQSKYSAAVIVEVPQETVLEIGKDPKVVSVELYSDDPQTPPEGFDGELPPDVAAELREVYLRVYGDPEYVESPEEIPDDMLFLKYYGNYHGYEIVHMCGFGLGLPASGTLELGGLEFRFANITDIDDFLAYRNGEFVEVRLLYEEGLLSQEDITNLWLTHQGIPLKANPFWDVSVTAWYYKGLRYCYDRRIMVGVDSRHFEPDAPMTRAMLVTVLWRMAGSPESVPSTFSDVKKGSWYAQAVGWAEANGVVNGIGDGKFGPEQNITREQIATILYRYSGSPSSQGSLSAYPDVDEISDFAAEGMRWARRQRIIEGVPSGDVTILAPQELASRAQVATMVMRYCDQLNSKNLIGISLPSVDLQRWKQDGNLMKSQLTGMKYTVDLQYADNDSALQSAQISDMIIKGARVLVVAPVDNDALTSVLEQAERAGVTVISYDRLIMYTDAVDYYVSFDNFHIGVMQGQYIVDALDLDNAKEGTTFNIEYITGDPFDYNMDFFFNGAMSVLYKYVEEGILVCRSGQELKFDVTTYDWDAELAQARFEHILSTYYANKPLHAVMANNDSTAQGVAAALETAYENDIYPVITGQDCDIISVQNMLNGKQAMSVFKDNRDLANRAVIMVDSIMKGEEPTINDMKTYDNGAGVVDSYLCLPKVCTVANYEALLIQSGYYTEDQLAD